VLDPTKTEKAFIVAIIAFCLVLCGRTVTAQTTQILVGSKLSPGYDMGVDSSHRRTDWLKQEDGQMKISYPAGQDWGAVFVTVGKPRRPPRPFRDFSTFSTLAVEMKGESGNEQLQIGVKTNEQPDDGSERKIPVKLTPEWQTYTFALDKFDGVNLRKLYVIVEFVFLGKKAETVYFRNVKYLGRDANKSESKRDGTPALNSSEQRQSEDPQITITQPADQYELTSWEGTQPSVLVRGTAKGVSPEANFSLIVHPTRSANSWTSKIALSGDTWVSQAFFGDPNGELPRDGESYEILAAVSDRPLPDTFNELPSTNDLSNVVHVKVRVVSWRDKAIAFGRDWQISVPITSFFTFLGVIATLVFKRFGERKQRRKRASS